MKYLLLATVMALLTLPACDYQNIDDIKPKDETAERTDFSSSRPGCINRIIEQIKEEPPRNPRAKVYSYTYNRGTVYYITAYCCDIPSDLYDSNCNLICHPNGGITGGVDPKCADFFEMRADEKLIWVDTRK